MQVLDCFSRQSTVARRKGSGREGKEAREGKSRAEISFVVSLLLRHMTKAGELHIALTKKVLRYLQSRKHLHLSWSARSCHTPHVPGEIYGWSDASFAVIKSNDGTNRASSIGWLFMCVTMCNNGPISWRSTNTPLIALNVAESEIIAFSSASTYRRPDTHQNTGDSGNTAQQPRMTLGTACGILARLRYNTEDDAIDNISFERQDQRKQEKRANAKDNGTPGASVTFGRTNEGPPATPTRTPDWANQAIRYDDQNSPNIDTWATKITPITIIIFKGF